MAIFDDPAVTFDSEAVTFDQPSIRFWRTGTRLVRDASGRLVICDDCPCPEDTGTGTEVGTGTTTIIIEDGGGCCSGETFTVSSRLVFTVTAEGLPIVGSEVGSGPLVGQYVPVYARLGAAIEVDFCSDSDLHGLPVWRSGPLVCDETVPPHTGGDDILQDTNYLYVALICASDLSQYFGIAFFSEDNGVDVPQVCDEIFGLGGVFANNACGGTNSVALGCPNDNPTGTGTGTGSDNPGQLTPNLNWRGRMVWVGNSGGSQTCCYPKNPGGLFANYQGAINYEVVEA